MSQSFEERKPSTKDWPKLSLEDIYGKGSSRRMEEHVREDSTTINRGSTLGIPDRVHPNIRGSVGTPKIGPLSPRLGPSGQTSPNVSIPPVFLHPSYSVYSKVGMDAMIQTFEQKQAKKTQEKRISKLTKMKTSSDKGSGDDETENDVHEEINGHSNGTSPITPQDKNANRGSVNGPSIFGFIAKPESMTEEEWMVHVLEFEASGEWIEARESLSGRILWFNSKSFRLVFDNPPPGVSPIPATMMAKA
ncbi:hypothetical protein RFI_18111, partial [Reticulomyxa filosa]